MCEIGEKTETILSSLQACFVITHSSGDFIVKNIHNHHLYNLQTCIKAWWEIQCFVQLLLSNALFLRWHEDTCSLHLFSDDNSGWWMISNFSLRQRLHLLLVLL